MVAACLAAPVVVPTDSGRKAARGVQTEALMGRAHSAATEVAHTPLCTRPQRPNPSLGRTPAMGWSCCRPPPLVTGIRCCQIHTNCSGCSRCCTASPPSFRRPSNRRSSRCSHCPQCGAKKSDRRMRAAFAGRGLEPRCGLLLEYGAAVLAIASVKEGADASSGLLQAGVPLDCQRT